MFHMDQGLIGFYRGKKGCSLTRPGWARSSHDTTPGIFPSGGFYETMETWEEALSPGYFRTSDHPEVGFHAVFGQVNPKWYMGYYMQLRRKIQVQRQIQLLIFDILDKICSYIDYLLIVFLRCME